MKVLSFAATNSRNSINKQLVYYVSKKFNSGSFDMVDISDYELPIYGFDMEMESGIPKEAVEFAAKLSQYDAVLISLAEHNGNFTVAFKNLFDWLSRIERNVYQNKKVILLSTSPASTGASTVLKLASDAMPHMGGELVGKLSIPNFFDNFDIDKNEFINKELSLKLDEVLKPLQ